METTTNGAVTEIVEWAQEALAQPPKKNGKYQKDLVFETREGFRRFAILLGALEGQCVAARAMGIIRAQLEVPPTITVKYSNSGKDIHVLSLYK